MELQHYTNDALLEILGLCTIDDEFKKYRSTIEDELRSRLRDHAHNTKLFSPYGITPALTKTKADFIKSFS